MRSITRNTGMAALMAAAIALSGCAGGIYQPYGSNAPAAQQQSTSNPGYVETKADRQAKRQENRVNRRVDREADRATDRAVDRALNSILK